MNEKLGIGMKLTLQPNVLRVDTGVHVALAHPHKNVLTLRHPSNVRAKEHVGKEKNLLVCSD